MGNPSNRTQHTFCVFTYEHIDNLHHQIPPDGVHYDFQEQILSELEDVKAAFREKGWEGDGEVGLFWIPSFLDQARDPNYGQYAWHVKQDNDGTSFIGLKHTIQSARLLDQNRQYKDEDGRLATPIHAVKHSILGTKKQLQNSKSALGDLTPIIDSIPDSISHATLTYVQNSVVAAIVEFFDECYLQLLQHVLEEGNTDSIKLNKRTIPIDLKRISSENGEYQDHWLTIREIISEIWRGFRFLQINEKFKEICSAIGYAPTDVVKYEISKHVAIRNCIQHHNEVLPNDILASLGRNSIEIRNDSGPNTIIKAWNSISLTPRELIALIDVATEFLDSFDAHVIVRLKSRRLHYNLHRVDPDNDTEFEIPND